MTDFLTNIEIEDCKIEYQWKVFSQKYQHLKLASLGHTCPMAALNLSNCPPTSKENPNPNLLLRFYNISTSLTHNKFFEPRGIFPFVGINSKKFPFPPRLESVWTLPTLTLKKPHFSPPTSKERLFPQHGCHDDPILGLRHCITMTTQGPGKRVLLLARLFTSRCTVILPHKILVHKITRFSRTR